MSTKTHARTCFTEGSGEQIIARALERSGGLCARALTAARDALAIILGIFKKSNRL